jgi:VanZ family protein
VIGVIPGRAALVLAYMAGIFWLSSLPAARVAAFGLGPELANLAHVPLFAGLGSVTLLALTGPPAPRVALAGVVALAFALFDEWHQTAVPGRVFSLADLGSDALGVTIGVAASLFAQGASRGRPAREGSE